MTFGISTTSPACLFTRLPLYYVAPSPVGMKLKLPLQTTCSFETVLLDSGVSNLYQIAIPNEDIRRSELHGALASKVDQRSETFLHNDADDQCLVRDYIHDS